MGHPAILLWWHQNLGQFLSNAKTTILRTQGRQDEYIESSTYFDHYGFDFGRHIARLS